MDTDSHSRHFPGAKGTHVSCRSVPRSCMQPSYFHWLACDFWSLLFTGKFKQPSVTAQELHEAASRKAHQTHAWLEQPAMSPQGFSLTPRTRGRQFALVNHGRTQESDIFHATLHSVSSVSLQETFQLGLSACPVQLVKVSKKSSFSQCV